MPHIDGRKHEHDIGDGRIVSRQRVYQIENKDKFNDYRKLWREANKGHIAEYNKTWRKNNSLIDEVDFGDAEKF